MYIIASRDERSEGNVIIAFWDMKGFERKDNYVPYSPKNYKK